MVKHFKAWLIKCWIITILFKVWELTSWLHSHINLSFSWDFVNAAVYLCYATKVIWNTLPLSSYFPTFALLLKKSPNQIIESFPTLPSSTLKTFWSHWNKRLSLKAPWLTGVTGAVWSTSYSQHGKSVWGKHILSCAQKAVPLGQNYLISCWRCNLETFQWHWCIERCPSDLLLAHRGHQTIAPLYICQLLSCSPYCTPHQMY